MSPLEIERCPHCGGSCLAYAVEDGTPCGSMAVKCQSCKATGPQRAWVRGLEESIIRAHNAFARRARAGQMLGEAAHEINRREGVTGERFVSLRGRADG